MSDILFWDIMGLEKYPKIPEMLKKSENWSTVTPLQPMYFEGKLVGCVKRAHEFDEALSDRVMFENLVGKASATFALKLLLAKTKLQPDEVEYIIECSEEACGDMNQRGGGNFAKAIGEMCGCINATSDTRSFIAGPVHALVEAAALAQTGIYKNVVVLAEVSKIGHNSKDHVKKVCPYWKICWGHLPFISEKMTG